MPEPIETMLAVLAAAGTVWLALGLLTSLFCKRHPARCHAILVAASIGTLLTPLFYFAVRQVNGGILPAAIQSARDSASVEPGNGITSPHCQPALPRESTQSDPLNHSQASLKRTGVAYHPLAGPDLNSSIDLTHAASPTATSPGAAWVAPFSWKSALLGTWLLFSLAMFLRLLRDFAAGSWLVRNSDASTDGQANETLAILARRMDLAQIPRLVISDQTPSPVLWAWSFPPHILIPNRRETSSVSEAIYLHELAHLARRDHLSALAAELVLCLLPWHPLTWWTRRSINARAEEACDDWAIASGCNPVDYAQTLVTLAPTSAAALRLAAVTKHSPLKGRIQRLLSDNSSHPLLGRGWVARLSCFCLFLAAVVALFQPRITQAHAHKASPELPLGAPSKELPKPPEEQKNGEVEVLVLSVGKPAEGATVWMEELTNERLENRVTRRVGPITVPKSGMVRFSVSADAFTCQFLAKNEQGHLGAGSYLWFFRKTLAVENRMTLELEKPGQIHGQLFFENKPLADAQCQFVEIHASRKMETKDQRPASLSGTHISAPPGGFPISAKTDREGRFSLAGIPEKCDVQVKVTKEGMGSGILNFPWAVNHAGQRQPVEVELDLGGSLQIAIEGEAKSSGLKPIWMSPIQVERTRNGRPLVHMVPGKSLNDPESSIPGLAGHASGTYRLSVPFDAKQGFHFGPSQVVKIEPGKATKITLKKIPLSECSGRIVDAKTGKGIPNLSFQLKGKEVLPGGGVALNSQDFIEDYPATTDAQGNYSIVCPGNHVYTVAFNQTMENQTDYEFPYWDETRQRWLPIIPQMVIADGEKARIPDVALPPSRVVTGIVRDNAGKVVDGPYQVFCTTRAVKEPKSPQFAQDRFTLSQLNPAVPLKIFVRKGNAVNLPSTLPVDKLDGTVEFAISEKNQVSATGRVVDAKGKPIPKASVTLVWLSEYAAQIRRKRMYDDRLIRPIETVETDDQGRFSFGGLWHQEYYFLRVQANGFNPKPLDRTLPAGESAESGETIDFGDYRLNEAQPKE